MMEEVKPAEPVTGQLKIKVLDSERVKSAAGEYQRLRELFLQSRIADTERTMQLNRDSASFYEKLAILDAGVIALFLNFLVSRPAGSHVLAVSFWSLFCPAGALLLLSLYFSGMSITRFHKTNALLAKNLQVFGFGHRMSELSRLSGIVARSVSGELQLETERIDLSWFLSGLEGLSKKVARDEEVEIEKENRKWHNASILASLAFTFTVLGIVLLCFFTVKMLSL